MWWALHRVCVCQCKWLHTYVTYATGAASSETPTAPDAATAINALDNLTVVIAGHNRTRISRSRYGGMWSSQTTEAQGHGVRQSCA